MQQSHRPVDIQPLVRTLATLLGTAAGWKPTPQLSETAAEAELRAEQLRAVAASCHTLLGLRQAGVLQGSAHVMQSAQQMLQRLLSDDTDRSGMVRNIWWYFLSSPP